MPDLSDLLVDLVMRPELRARAREDLDGVLSSYVLTEAQREVVLAGDGRMLALLGEALEARPGLAPAGRRASAEGGGTAGESVGGAAADGAGDRGDAPGPPAAPRLGPATRLRLRVQPAVLDDGTVHYAAGTCADPDGATVPAGLPTPPGHPLPPVDVHLTLQPELTDVDGGFHVEIVPTVRAIAPLLPLPSRLPASPDPWGHRAGGDPVQALADAVLAGQAPLRQLLDAVRAGPPQAPDRPAPGDPRHADLLLVGTGLLAGLHLTREAEEAIRGADRVLHLDPGVGADEVLSALNPRCEALFGRVYADARPRPDVYVAMAEAVLQPVLDGERVAFAIQGHPLVGMYAPALLEDAARLLGKTVHVVPGLSSLDTLFADLRLDPFVHGVQAFEATDLLLRRRALDPAVPAVIWQVGAVGSRLYSARRSRPERFVRLARHLGRTYPADHPVVVYLGANHPLQRPQRVAATVATLPDHAAVLSPGVTLLIPPVGAAPVVDAGVVATLDDAGWLEAMTGSG